MSNEAVLLTVRPRSDSSAVIDSALFQLVYNNAPDEAREAEEMLDATVACAISKKEEIAKRFQLNGSLKSGQARSSRPARMTREIADLIAWELELQCTPLSPDELDLLYTNSLDRLIVSSERSTF